MISDSEYDQNDNPENWKYDDDNNKNSSNNHNNNNDNDEQY